jgi:hypothetical protein
MTPEQIEQLMIIARGNKYEGRRESALELLERAGLIEKRHLTERGKVLVAALTNTPLPVQIWAMPSND